jgi:serine/threonine-protein kinase RsbW
VAWARELAIDAIHAEAERASDWLEAACREKDVPPMLVNNLVLSLNEAIANVIDHGGLPEPPPPILLRLDISSDANANEASVTISDAGREFDPVSATNRERPTSLEEASARGMGIEMIRRCSDVLHYRREGGRNHLTFGTRWPNSTSATPR